MIKLGFPDILMTQGLNMTNQTLAEKLASLTSTGAPNVQAALREAAPGREFVVVKYSREDVRGALFRVLKAILPEFTVQTQAPLNPHTTALTVAETNVDNILRSLRDSAAISMWMPASDPMPVAQERAVRAAFERSGLYSLTPSSIPNLRSVLFQACLRELGLLDEARKTRPELFEFKESEKVSALIDGPPAPDPEEESQKEARMQILESIGSGYTALANDCLALRSQIKKDGVDLGEDADIIDNVDATSSRIFEWCEFFAGFIAIIKSDRPVISFAGFKGSDGRKGNTVNEVLQIAIHEVSNLMTIMFGEMQFLSELLAESDETGYITEEVKGFLKKCSRVLSITNKVREAYHGRMQWDQIEESLAGEGVVVEKFVIPEVLLGDLVVVVIDDEPAIGTVVKHAVRKNAEVVVVSDIEGFEALAPQNFGEKQVLVLLDHNLSHKGKSPFKVIFGHELIEGLREKLPSAWIVGHSSAAGGPDLEAYTEAGVDVVGKAEWNAVSRKLAYFTEGTE